jgi:hypothetical protein
MGICHINRQMMKNGAIEFGSLLTKACRPHWEDVACVVIVE